MELLLLGIIILLLIVISRLYFLQKVYTHSSNGISIISSERIVDCNDKLVELFEYDSKKEFLQVHPLKLSPPFQPDGQFSFQKATKMMALAQKQGSCRFDWVFLTKKGQTKHIEIDIIKVKDFFFWKEKYFMIWRDIDKRIAVEEQLKKLNENLENVISEKIEKNKKQEQMLFRQSKQAQIGEMLSMIAHQWRQPLGAISSSVIDIQMKIMLQDLEGEKLLHYISKELQNIEDFTQNLTNIVDDFKDFYKVTKEKESVSILSPLRKAYQIIEKSFDEANIKLGIRCQEDVSFCMFEGEIIQVLLSILQNAKENFLQKNIQNPTIQIEVTFDENTIQINICDNGKGIKKENLDKIFQPYFTTKEKKNGTGLGLYMAQKIIQEHHNGIIEVKNSSEGVCFTIKLQKG